MIHSAHCGCKICGKYTMPLLYIADSINLNNGHLVYLFDTRFNKGSTTFDKNANTRVYE